MPCWLAKLLLVGYQPIYLPVTQDALSCIYKAVCNMAISTNKAQVKARMCRSLCALFHVYIYTCADVPFSGNTLGHQLSFCFTQRLISLHWTVKCSNLFLLGPDGSWMAAKMPAVLWYMGFPALTLGSPFLLPVITRAYALSQREIENSLSQSVWGKCGLQELSFFFFAVAKIEICCVWAAALNLVRHGCVVFCLFATRYCCVCETVTF